MDHQLNKEQIDMAKKDEMKKKAGKAKAKTAKLGDKSPSGKKFTPRKRRKTINRRSMATKRGR